jgi:hypothetical protein
MDGDAGQDFWLLSSLWIVRTIMDLQNCLSQWSALSFTRVKLADTACEALSIT